MITDMKVRELLIRIKGILEINPMSNCWSLIYACKNCENNQNKICEYIGIKKDLINEIDNVLGV